MSKEWCFSFLLLCVLCFVFCVLFAPAKAKEIDSIRYNTPNRKIVSVWEKVASVPDNGASVKCNWLCPSSRIYGLQLKKRRKMIQPWYCREKVDIYSKTILLWRKQSNGKQGDSEKYPVFCAYSTFCWKIRFFALFRKYFVFLGVANNTMFFIRFR